jgi:putative membrane protein
MKKTFFLLSLSVLVCFASIAQVSTAARVGVKTGIVGKTQVAVFNTLNAQGAKLVKAIRPTKAALSSADNDLFTQVAMGGQKQLAISRAVLSKATNAQVKLLAQSEVEEQTTISAKLKEIATAKGITLPTEADATVQTLVSEAGSLSGAELDAFYIVQGGIKGHQELQSTMTTVRETAKDPALKALATATLPVIKLHLKVSTEVQTSMNASASSTGR